MKRLGPIKFSAKLNLILARLAPCLLLSLALFLSYISLILLIDIKGHTALIALSSWAAVQIALIIKTIITFKFPTDEEAELYLETTENLKNKPFQTLKDQPFDKKSFISEYLWSLHQEKQRKKLESTLKFKMPALQFAPADPYALRIIVFLLFICAATISGSSFLPRIKQSFTPFSYTQNHTSAYFYTHIWITPPAYTERPITKLSGYGRKEPIEIAEGSHIKIRNKSLLFGLFTPEMSIGSNVYKLERYDNFFFGTEAPLPTNQNTSIKLTEGLFPRADWPITILDDKEPSIAPDGAINFTEIGEIKIPLKLEDDYGVTKLHLSADLSPVVEEGPLFAKTYRETRTLNTPANKETSVTLTYNLTQHLWAGLPVIINLIAEDAAGQQTLLEPFEITLPERPFSNTVAKKLIEMRQRLAWNAEQAFEKVTEDMIHVLAQPSRLNHDTVTFLNLSTAFYRMIYAPVRKTAQELITLFWQVAIRIEDQGHTERIERLAKAIQDMMEAIQENADDTVLAEKFEELAKALDEYVDSLANQIEESLKQADPQQNYTDRSKIIKKQDFDDFMGSLLQDLQRGSDDQAMDKLSRLEDFLNNIVPDLRSGTPKEFGFSKRGADELQTLIEEQETLLSQTQQQLNALLRGEAIDTRPNAIEQKALRNILGELMRESAEILGDIPEGLGMAELEMRRSEIYLSQNNPSDAVTAQEKALDHLREGQENMMQQMQQQLQAMQNPLNQGQGTDPLGRQRKEEDSGDPLMGSDVKIPNEAEKKKVQEILRTLRERAGDYERPAEERGYIRRLLKQF